MRVLMGLGHKVSAPGATTTPSICMAAATFQGQRAIQVTPCLSFSISTLLVQDLSSLMAGMKRQTC